MYLNCFITQSLVCKRKWAENETDDVTSQGID